jgi:hypothetical protein
MIARWMWRGWMLVMFFTLSLSLVQLGSAQAEQRLVLAWLWILLALPLGIAVVFVGPLLTGCLESVGIQSVGIETGLLWALCFAFGILQWRWLAPKWWRWWRTR